MEVVLLEPLLLVAVAARGSGTVGLEADDSAREPVVVVVVVEPAWG